jgi:hypothetical protein
MAQQMQTRRNRTASPERWQRAAQRALEENFEVRQVNENGMWVSTSGSDPKLAYLLEVRNGVVASCSCPAGQFGDPCCKHAARYYLDAGPLDPEPEPPAPVAPVVCFKCRGKDALCPVCAGAGVADLAAQAAALIAEADAGWEPTPKPAAPAAMVARIGQAGHIAGYDVFLAGDTLHVIHAARGREWRHVVPNFGTALADLARQPGLRLGWARSPDDAEAIYVYDAEDGNLGYALNLSDPALSEWGYAPFTADEDAPTCDHCGGPLADDAATDDAMQTVCGACVDRARREAEAALAAAITEAHRYDTWERAQLAA